MQMSRRSLLTSLAFSGLVVGAGRPLAQTGLQLHVYERSGCPWCVRWDREVAEIYPRTETGKRVPFRRIKLDGDQALIPKLADPVRFTPTFVLMNGDREVSRITGYMDEATFWGMLERQVADAIKA
jgi:hypothetical protein